MSTRPRERKSRRAKGLALAIFGFVMGTVTGMLVFGAKIDRLTLENETLREQLRDLKEAYERLRDQPPRPSRPVRELSLEFINLKDERIRLELNRRLRALLVDRIVGTSVTELDPLLAARIVDDRTFVVEETLWRVKVVGAYLIWETLILYIQVQEEAVVVGRSPWLQPTLASSRYVPVARG